MQNSLKDRVLEAIDIVEVVGERVSLRRKGKDFIGLCPFHDDHKPSFAVSPKKQIFKCWSCGVGGDVIKFVQLRDRVDFREALATLARRAGIESKSSPEARQSAQLREQLLRTMEWACAHFRRNLRETAGGRAAFEYARRRGLSEATIEKFGVGFAAAGWDDVLRAGERTGIQRAILHQTGLIATNESGKTYDRFRNRLILPIRDGLGRGVAFGGRALDDDPAKYLNSPETVLFSKSRILYGLDAARRAIETQREAVVVEGYLDAVLLHQHGIENVVATLGTALTEAHVRLLRPLADRVLLCFDGDQAGVRAADRAVETALRGRIQVRVLVLPDGQDPADCVNEGGAAGFAKLLPSAVDALEFKWSLTLRGFAQDEPHARRAAVEDFLQFVARSSAAGGIDPLQQGLLVGRLAETLALPPATVYELLARAHGAARRAARTDSSDISETSAYDASIRGLPAGMVAAVEELFGLLVEDSNCFAWVTDDFAQAVQFCDPWRRFDGIIRVLIEESGTFTRQNAQARCDDAELCELMERCGARLRGAAATQEAFASALARLASELDLQRMGDLQGHLREADRGGNDAEQAFRSLLEMGRRQQAVLSAENRWMSTAS